MAKVAQPDEIKKALSKEADLILRKKKLTRNNKWTPVGGEHGPGLIPGEAWKAENPKSKQKTEVNK